MVLAPLTGLGSLNHNVELRSKSFPFGKAQASLAFRSLNHNFFTTLYVDAGCGGFCCRHGFAQQIVVNLIGGVYGIYCYLPHSDHFMQPVVSTSLVNNLTILYDMTKTNRFGTWTIHIAHLDGPQQATCAVAANAFNNSHAIVILCQFIGLEQSVVYNRVALTKNKLQIFIGV